MKRNTLIFIFLLFMCSSHFSCSEKDSTATSKITNPDELDALLNNYVKEGFYPFIYARLEDIKGKVIYEHSTVNEELLPNAKVDGNTWIRIWSMSKIVTIAIALDLVEDRVISLNDPVSKYIPEFKNLKVAVSNNGSNLNELEWGNRENVCPVQLVPNDSVMTILHLINHQAGFYYATTGFSCLDSMVVKQNLPTAKNSDELVERMSNLPLVQHSGNKYFYGTNTTVLGIVAERASGKSLKQLVEERVTEPMNIEDLQYEIPANQKLLPKFTGRDSILRKAEAGELDIFGPDVPDYDLSNQLFLGGEGMVATADGYADFLRMLLNKGDLNGHRFLDKETVEDIYAPHTQLDNAYGYNGYNLWISGDSMRLKEQGDAGLWLGGGYESTHFWVDPKRKFVGVIMSQNNEVRSPGYDMNDKFRGALYKQFWDFEKNN